MSKKKGYFRKYFFYDVTKVFTYPLWFIFFRPKRIAVGEKANKKIKGGALVCLNHNFAGDVVYIQMVNPHRHNIIVGGEVAFVNGFVSLLLKLLLTVPINREAFSYGQFRNIVNYLKEGRLVNIFCEGHLNDDHSKIAEVKEGPALMAYYAKVPIYPVYVKTRDSKFERLKIYYGDPIDFNELRIDSRDKLKDVTSMLQDRLESLRKKAFEDYQNTRRFKRQQRKKENKK